MRTLFLNPNSSHEITDVFNQQIAARIMPVIEYDVAMLEDAPPIIASMLDNERSRSVLLERVEELSGRYGRIVLMSSLDTGFDALRDHARIEVHGFTRSVLLWNKSRGQPLHAVTFDATMTPLYEQLFDAEDTAGVIQGITTLPVSPAEVADSRDSVMAALRGVCRKLSRTGAPPLFIVGAVGLQFSDALRGEDGVRIVDPVADMLAQLHMCARRS